MEKYEYSKEWDKCTYWLDVVKSCRHCIFETLCRLDKDKCKDTHDQKKTSENC